MNLLLTLTLISFIAIGNITKASKNVTHCDNKRIFSTIPNEILDDVKFSTSVDLIRNLTQIEIDTKFTKNFHKRPVILAVSSEESMCRFSEEYELNSKDFNSTKIPGSNNPKNELKPGCNYKIEFLTDESCYVKFYEIPELKPCINFPPEKVFDSFPNKVIEAVSVDAFYRNSIRLNISLSPNAEFMNRSGYIVLKSKTDRCNDIEEYSFVLNQENVIVPKGEYPATFLDSGCEYILDFEVNQTYCITTTYTVPDFCKDKRPDVELDEITAKDSDRFKITWKTGNDTHSGNNRIKDVIYRLDNVKHRNFNPGYILVNDYHSNFSILNFSQVSKGQAYKLIATFINEEDCSIDVSKEVFIPMEDDEGPFFKIFIITFAVLVVILISCIFVPKGKTVFILKYFFRPIAETSKLEASEGKLLTRINKKEEINLDYIPLELGKCDEFEIAANRLVIDTKGSPRAGNFGVVYIGKAYGLDNSKTFTTVAIKTLRENAPLEDQNALNDEIETLKKISSHGNHENVVKMFGCCTIKEPKMLILEYVECGDLKNYLVNLREEWSKRKCTNRFIFPSDGSKNTYISTKSTKDRTISETSSNAVPSPTETESTIVYDELEEHLLNDALIKIKPALSSEDLENFALQIAKGMEFLERNSIVHRDLAARNVLISEAKTLKISDFGMSRFGDYVHRNNGQQPIRWMAIESIESCVCTSKSDVWSFGVVLWEIGTLGAFPYDNVSNECILEHLLHNLKRGIRLIRPEICTNELYSLMLKCWSENPDERPTFEQIVRHLSGENRKIYLDFQKLNPAYVFPPTKL